MSRGVHVNIDELQAGGPVDEEHVANCAQCRRVLAVHRFVTLATTNAPQLEPSPYFAKRVTRLALTQNQNFHRLLQQVAQRLIPILAVLVLAVTALFYHFSQDDLNGEISALVLFEQPAEDEVTLDFVLSSLQAEEDPSFE